MKNDLTNRHFLQFAPQRGLALIVALIALVAMSLAAVALVWAVDVNVGLQSNLAFRQSAAQFADRATEEARTWLLANQASLTANSTTNGYYAADPERSGTCGEAAWTGVDFTGVCSDQAAERVAWKKEGGEDMFGDITPKCANTDTSTGNRACYVIHRLCALAGAFDPNDSTYPAGQSCAIRKPEISKDGQTLDLAGRQQALPDPPPAVIYRITTRVAGPRDNAAYTQTFVLL
jgi:Tfp pilus assembly protein PilX